VTSWRPSYHFRAGASITECAHPCLSPQKRGCNYDPLPFIATATNKVVKEKPDAVVAYLRGWLRAVKLLKEDPLRAAGIYAADQKALGRDVPVAVLDRALRRMTGEPEITPKMERYLADQAKDLVAGTGEYASP
jgi:ABC-type nitrate/sulfonate/bicarbonate transport system substrate-binding protein